jgi:Polysaccharide biosynthesis C-terminal domain
VLVSVLMPIVVLMTVLAPQVVAVLYGAKWAPADTALRFLMILAAVRLLAGVALDILTGAGATRASLWVNLGWCLVLIPALLIGTHISGIRGTAMAHALVGVFVALPLAIIALRHTGVHLGPIPRSLLRPLTAAAVCALASFAAARAAGPIPLVQLLVAGTVGMACYLGICVPGEQRRAFIARLRHRAVPARGGRHRRSNVMRAALTVAEGLLPPSLEEDEYADLPAPVSPPVSASASARTQTLTAVPKWPTYIGTAAVPTVYRGYARVPSAHEPNQ